LAPHSKYLEKGPLYISRAHVQCPVLKMRQWSLVLHNILVQLLLYVKGGGQCPVVC